MWAGTLIFYPITRCLLPWFKNDLWEELSWGFLEHHQSEASQAMGTLSACSFLFFSSSFPKITAVNFLFYVLVLKRHQRFLSFLSSFGLVAFWFFNLLRAVMLCLQYSVTTSHREEHSKVSHFSFAGRSEKMTFDTVEYISFHVFCQRHSSGFDAIRHRNTWNIYDILKQEGICFITRWFPEFASFNTAKYLRRWWWICG